MFRGLAIVAVLITGLLIPGLSRGLVDPTRPPDVAPLAESPSELADESLRLSSILISPARRVAVINNRVVRVGDHVLNAEVLEIETYVVHLRGPDGAFTLRLLGEPMKRTAAEGR